MGKKVSQLRRDLTKLKTLLTGRWIQDEFEAYKPGSTKMCYCIVGGIGQVVTNDPYGAETFAQWEEETSPGKRTIALVETIRRFIPKAYRHKIESYSNRHASMCSQLIDWNDKHKRTEAQVLGVLEKALSATP